MTPLEALEAALRLPDNAKLIIIPPRFNAAAYLDAAEFLKDNNFIGGGQLATMLVCARRNNEEHAFFRETFAKWANIIDKMPHSYETDGQGQKAVAHLHYFAGGQANWWITEKDVGNPGEDASERQWQAFGRADLFGDGGELGHICLPEIIANGGELDLYWKPQTLEEIE